jgi:hypothetical protein
LETAAFRTYALSLSLSLCRTFCMRYKLQIIELQNGIGPHKYFKRNLPIAFHAARPVFLVIYSDFRKYLPARIVGSGLGNFCFSLDHMIHENNFFVPWRFVFCGPLSETTTIQFHKVTVVWMLKMHWLIWKNRVFGLCPSSNVFLKSTTFRKLNVIEASSF